MTGKRGQVRKEGYDSNITQILKLKVRLKYKTILEKIKKKKIILISSLFLCTTLIFESYSYQYSILQDKWEENVKFFSNVDKIVNSKWGIGGLENSTAVLLDLWDVILAGGHCLTGILHVIVKNNTNAFSKLQLTPPDSFSHRKHIWPLTLQKSLYNVPVKINNGGKT